MVRSGCGCDMNGPECQRALQCRQDMCSSGAKTIQVEEEAEFGCVRGNDR